MICLERLIQYAVHRERVASRRLVRSTGISEHEALYQVMLASAGEAGLDALLLEREAVHQASAARAQQRKAQHAADRLLKQQRHDGEPTPWRAWFDGSAHPNPGHVSIGGVLQGPHGHQHTISQQAGFGNSSEAEYRALIAVLEAAVAAQADDLTIYGDSQGVIDDVLAAAGAPSLSILRQQAKALIEQLPKVRLRWIPRHKNAHADALSQQAARRPPVMR